MIHGFSFATADMTISGNKCIESMTRWGVHKSCLFRETDDVIKELMVTCPNVMKQPRGFGYWLWKPWLIYKCMLGANEGDILVYADAGVEIVGNLHQAINSMDQDVFLFGNMWLHNDWCKRDVNVQILGSQQEVLTVGRKQAQASVVIVRNTPWARAFIQEWLSWCSLAHLVDDSPSGVANYAAFREHRHDQAVLTTLAIRDGIQLHWWPASYDRGRFIYSKEGYERDGYGVLFNHHRKRNSEW